MMHKVVQDYSVTQFLKTTYLLEWLISFFMASLEMAWPQTSLTGGLASVRERWKVEGRRKVEEGVRGEEEEGNGGRGVEEEGEGERRREEERGRRRKGGERGASMHHITVVLQNDIVLHVSIHSTCCLLP